VLRSSDIAYAARRARYPNRFPLDPQPPAPYLRYVFAAVVVVTVLLIRFS